MNMQINAPKPGGWLRWFVGALSILAVPMYGQQALPRSVVAAGGSVMAVSSSNRLSATIGQVVAGSSYIQLYEANNQGFWLPIERATSVRPDEGVVTEAGVSAYPNPFATITTIRVPGLLAGEISIRIRDLVGSNVRTLASQATAGTEHHIVFDGLNDLGEPLAAGAYTYQVSARSVTGQPLRFSGRLQVLR